jgi:hypothetical protein
MNFGTIFVYYCSEQLNEKNMSNYEIAKLAIENFEYDYGLPPKTRFSYDNVITIVKDALRIQNNQINKIIQNCL